MNGTKKHSFYLLVICTVVMFGIAAYLLVSGGSSHGTIWGGRYGDKLEGTINGYGVLMIAVGMLFTPSYGGGRTGRKAFPFQWEKWKTLL